MRRIAVLSAVMLLAAIILAPTARAQGFAVYEHDACVMARAAAGVAAPCSGGSAVFFNPAAIQGSAKPWNVQAGLTLIAPVGSFTDSATRTVTNLNKRTFPVPFGYLTRQLGSSFAVGIGAFAPYGLTTDWPTTSPGRYLAYKTTLASIYVQPTIAYAITPTLQLGVGADYVSASAKVYRRLDASAVPIPGGGGATLALLGVPSGTDFADVLFNVSGTGWGFHGGLLWKATEQLSIGARYMSQVKVKFTGNATFTPVATGIALPAGNPICNPPGLPALCPAGTPLENALMGLGGTTLQNQSASANITMPSQIVVGLAYKVTPQLRVMADWQYTDWTVFKSLDLKLNTADTTISAYEGYAATSGFRVGFDWQASSTITIRGGALTHKGASPDESVTPILPEGQRIEGTVGVGIQMTPVVRLDLGYQYVYQADRHGRVTDPSAGVTPTTALNSGLFKFSANLFSASLALAF